MSDKMKKIDYILRIFATVSICLGLTLVVNSQATRQSGGGSATLPQSLGTGDSPTFALITATTGVAVGTNPASTGTIRIPNNSSIFGRNSANSGNIEIIGVDTGNSVSIAGGSFRVSSASILPVDDNTQDIGSVAKSLQTGYYDTSVITPLIQSTTAKILLKGTGTGAVQIASTQTTKPTCSTNCGTDPTVVGSDSDMIVTMGTSGSPASGWVITFNGTWAAAPTCSVTMGKTGMVVGKLALTVVTTTTTITVVTNGTAPSTTDVYHIMCRGVQ